MELTNFIKVYDDVLSKEECDQFIQIFEKAGNIGKTKYYDDGLRFTQYWVPPSPFTKSVQTKIRNTQNDYCVSMEEFLDCNVFPRQCEFEQFKVKRYIPKEKEEFKTHIDASDLTSCQRFLSCLVYLNDVEEGGQTVFNDVTIEPKVGRLIIFPPLWMYPHSGKCPISNTKYILGTYLRYI
tara:strand:- start:296 stop:838 length:543 start_codon:yes stop_codon:yes gene_type:complete